jgi:hypothetical protein
MLYHGLWLVLYLHNNTLNALKLHGIFPVATNELRHATIQAIRNLFDCANIAVHGLVYERASHSAQFVCILAIDLKPESIAEWLVICHFRFLTDCLCCVFAALPF